MARLKTPISYYGGKQMLLKHILPLIPEHTLYTEAFCGGCAVLFAKPLAQCEVINDTNTELVNFYRVAQTQYAALKAMIDATLHSREIHAHARHINEHPSFFTPVERAWAVWVCTKLGFASMIDGTFGYDRSGTTTLKLRNAKEAFTEELCSRLGRVTVECEDGIDVIRRYDCPEAFHFVDSPYVGSDCGHYNGTFDEEDFSRLLDTLVTVEGKFMLTMVPHEKIERLAARNDWTIHRLDRTITAYIASCSFGKDSIATILLALEHGEPLDVVRSEKDYLTLFHTVIGSGTHKGMLRGWLISGKCCANRDLKIRPIHRYYARYRERGVVQFVGIAADEPRRLAQMQDKGYFRKTSLLAKYGYTEADARRKCEEYGLLSPLYRTSHRGGCWFCPNCRIPVFAELRRRHPELWRELQLLSKVENKSSEGFKYGQTFEEVERQMDLFEYAPTLF